MQRAGRQKVDSRNTAGSVRVAGPVQRTKPKGGPQATVWFQLSGEKDSRAGVA